MTFKSKKNPLLLLSGLAVGILAWSFLPSDVDFETKTIDQPERSWNVASAVGPFSNLQIILSLQKK